MKDTAILESIVGAWEIRTSTPMGKELLFVFKKSEEHQGKCVCEVPIRLEYTDQQKNNVVINENYAQFLLNNYSHLRLVKHKKAPVVIQPDIVDPNAPVAPAVQPAHPVQSEEEGKPKKGK